MKTQCAWKSHAYEYDEQKIVKIMKDKKDESKFDHCL